MQSLIQTFFWLIARIPLPVLHVMGRGFGYLMYIGSAGMRIRIKENLHISRAVEDYQNSGPKVKSVCQEIAKSALELPIAWTRSSEDIAALFTAVEGWAFVEEAIQQKQGLLFITPHIGSYDLAGRYISHQLPFPLTAMYRPPKLSWLEPVMNAGRVRDKGKTAPANAQGVRQVLRALRDKEATIILPDQVPSGGDGIWVPFFGKPAYTMTLAARLAGMKNVQTFFFVGERLPNGKGFKLHIRPLNTPLTQDKVQDTLIINQAVESLILEFPTQYLFSYNRYKVPAGAERPPAQ